ncbi:S41 family peptidase [Prevotella sp. KH2C16]|uniref:S41 family peptidase n=1 Tax=Prevotella sp. KH2C16 TaxID=1855325 RepID=UPI0008EA2DB9|nr:S41 family peptidase [Prevotella sp. KH2C16]SFG03786.1 carboxyl-terminal processing protease [Prevotella sp. KH2C16]
MKKLLFCLLLLGAMPVEAQENKDHNLDVAKNLDVMNVIYKYLDMMYVDTLDANEVVGNGIKSMLKSLDPYTVYYSESDVNELRTMITGKYVGVGMLIRWNFQLQNAVVDEPYENTPSAEAGLKKGDVILSIDGESMKGKDTKYVSEHLRGDAGSTFELVVRRPSTGRQMKFRITRRSIYQTPAVPYYGVQEGNIGYINLSGFVENSAKAVRRAYVEMRQKGIKGLIVDLRNNGGGSEQEAVDIVNMFVPKGKLVVSNRGKLKRANHDYITSMEPIDTVMPLVVLVNGNTASASEIMSGALQDFDRGVILGTRTYGKGIAQMTLDLPYNGQLKLTTNKWYTPSGRCIQAVTYKHARGGSTVQKADSTAKVFLTEHGREVKDVGGIVPDIEVKADSLPNIAYYLAAAVDSNEVLHNYEVDYIARHPAIAPAGEFSLSDADYEEFKQRVMASNFKYDRESEKYLKNLKELAKFEGYYDEAKPEFEALENKLKHNVAKDLDYNKRIIKHMIENDIVAAYYYQKGSIENSLRDDKQVAEALKLLHDEAKYREILQSKKK